jgi:hypothetical protein
MQEEIGPDGNFLPFADEGLEMTELVDSCMSEMAQKNTTAAQLENRTESIQIDNFFEVF